MTKDIHTLIDARDFAALKALLNQAGTDELVTLLRELDDDEQLIAFRMLDTAQAADVYDLLTPSERSDLIGALSQTDQDALFGNLPVDDQAELLSELPEQVVTSLLEHLAPSDREAVTQVLEFEPGTVGRHANPRFVDTLITATVNDVHQQIRASDLASEELTSVFVVNHDGNYEGLVRLADLIRHDGSVPVSTLMDTDAPVAKTGDDAAMAGRILQRHDLGAMAVIDDEGQLVGSLVFDDAMDAIAADVSDTMFQKAGVGDVFALKDRVRSEQLIGGPILYPVRVRLLFLMVTLVGGLAVGGLIDTFEDTLAAIVSVAIFIPLVMDMGGNVGTQSTTIFARGLALGHIEMSRFSRFLFREVRVGLIMAAVLGTIGGTAAYLWQGAPNDVPMLGVAVGVALAFSVAFASFLGFMLPYLLVKIGADHAPGADPFLTTMKDFSGLAVYFLLVNWLLGVA